ncbi:MAG TPA: META domain-containing protein [Herpetosiphonaceae bacterium]
MTPPDQSSSPTSEPEGTPSGERFTNKQWLLTQYGPSEQPLAPLTEKAPVVTFHDDGRLDGSTGCNSYFGSYAVEGERLTIGQLGQTEMACDGPVMQQEQAFLQALAAAGSFSATANSLTITYTGGQLNFTLVQPPRAAPLLDTTWQISAFEQGDTVQSLITGSQITLKLANGTVGGNAGCNHYGGAYTVEGQQITFGEIQQTLMACADAGVMEQETRYITALRAVTAWAIDGNNLVLSYDGGALHFTAQAASQ